MEEIKIFFNLPLNLRLLRLTDENQERDIRYMFASTVDKNSAKKSHYQPAAYIHQEEEAVQKRILKQYALRHIKKALYIFILSYCPFLLYFFVVQHSWPLS